MTDTLQFDPKVLAKAKELLLQNGLVRTYDTPILDKHMVIRCKLCDKISHNPNDVYNLYCGRCKVFHIDLIAAINTGAI